MPGGVAGGELEAQPDEMADRFAMHILQPGEAAGVRGRPLEFRALLFDKLQ